MGPALSYNSPAATLMPRNLPQLAALLLTAEQPYNSPAATLMPRNLPQLAALLLTAEQPKVELDLEITAGSYNAKVLAKVNFPVFQLNFN